MKIVCVRIHRRVNTHVAYKTHILQCFNSDGNRRRGHYSLAANSLILIFRNHIGAPACFPCKPILPIVGCSLNGLFSHAGFFEPSGLWVAECHWRMSIVVTCSPFRTTSIKGPSQVMVMRFHSPAGFTICLRAASLPKMAPQRQVGLEEAHFSAKSSVS